MMRFDFGVSITNYPASVTSMIRRAIPWTVGLLLTATLISFAIGTIVGAMLAWGKAPLLFARHFSGLFYIVGRALLSDGYHSALFLPFRFPFFHSSVDSVRTGSRS